MRQGIPPPRAWSYRLWALVVVSAFLGIAVAPIALTFFNSLRNDGAFTLEAYTNVLAQTRQWILLENTLAVAGGSTALAIGIGVAFALALEYVRVPARRLLLVVGVIPLLIPGYVTAVAWVDVFGANGLLQGVVNRIFGTAWTPPSLNNVSGVIVISALSYYPIVLLTTRTALQRLDARFEEAARLTASPMRAFWRIVFPLTIPSITVGALMVFLLTLVGFAVPSLLQVNVYSVEIFTTFSAFYDTSTAVAQSLPLLVCGLCVLLAGDLYVGSRRGWLSGAARPRLTPSGGPVIRGFAAAGCWAVVALSSAVPIAVLIWSSWPWTTYLDVFATARGEILTSLAVSTTAATLITVFGFSLAYIESRGAHRFPRATTRRRTMATLCIAPFLISGPVLGAAFIALWNRPGLPGMVYDSLLILVLACVARFAFFAERGFAATMNSLDKSLEEAACVFGVSWWRTALRIVCPLTWPTAVGVWGLSFVFCFGEIDATALLCPPGRNTLTMRVFSLMHYGPSPMVAALCVITVALILLCGGVMAVVYTYIARNRAARQRGVHGCD